MMYLPMRTLGGRTTFDDTTVPANRIRRIDPLKTLVEAELLEMRFPHLLYRRAETHGLELLHSN